MLVLFDHGTPRGLTRELPDHVVASAKSMGWERLNNGELLEAAEEAEFEVLLTTDQGIRYQQNLADRKIAIVVLTGNTKWSQIRLHCERIAEAVNAAVPGSFAEVLIPFEKRPRDRIYNQ